ncbi:MAG TPA: MBOAT family protein [Reyranella sp.]|nr:MBOAT family protein [Reyranella sp.]
MAFSSNFFIFAYLPLVLLGYFVTPDRMKNATLLVASLVFYAFDAGHLAWLLVVSIALNHVAGRAIARRTGKARHVIFALTVVANLAFLLHYKYTAFIWQSVEPLLSMAGLQIGKPPSIELPIGISFFTFQAISYVADIYTGRIVPARRFIDFGAYHSLFPQLIAGPIVRYVEIEKELYDRRGSLGDFADGLYRFCLGLGKKLILGDTMGVVADQVFSLPTNELTSGVAWFGVLAYTLQIYFDFSGYSDMAIGLGRMLGFPFPENFNQPYRAQSITEFWRRWHMTLSRWFRDYVYIPLGGNRLGPARTYCNLVIVFFLCGLWHGAGWTFVVWGLYHGFWLAAERMYVTHVGPLPGGWLAWARTFLIVVVGWVFFRASSLEQAVGFLQVMAGLSSPTVVFYELQVFASPHNVFFALCGLGFALLPFERFSMRLEGDRRAVALKAAGAVVLFGYSIALLSVNSFNPFIYFRF